MRNTRLAWGALALILTIAIGRAATATPISGPPPATEAQKQEMFFALAGDERQFRRDAAKDFPADAWSQDDAFHNLEYKRAKQLAGARGVRFADVLWAIDEGMHRSDWPRPPGVWQNPTVPPCRPRPIH